LLGKEFDPIGDTLAIFYGTYNGQGYEVKNLNPAVGIHATVTWVGMFGFVGGDALIQRVVVINPDFTGQFAGGVVGWMTDDAQLKNSLVKYSNLYGVEVAGGLVGRLAENSKVLGCISIVDSIKASHCGGAIGRMGVHNTVVLGGKVNSPYWGYRVVGGGAQNEIIENVYALDCIRVKDTLVTTVLPDMENSKVGGTFSLEMGKDDLKRWWEIVARFEFTETGVTYDEKPWFWSGQDFPVLRSVLLS